MDGSQPLIIAHRGASAFAPENTRAAFQKAVELGAEGIEFDVRLARDGVPVVFHDVTLQRVGQKSGVLSDFTSEELQNLDIGSWFNRKNPKKAEKGFAAETVPTLARLLEHLRDYDGLLYIELKHTDAETSAMVEAVSRIIRQTNLLPNIIVKSFNLDAIYQMRRQIPEVRTAALFAPKFRTILHKETRLLEKAIECEADEISMHYSLATQSFIKKAGKSGFRTTIWTVNSLIWVRRAFEMGVNAVITNDPAKLLAQKRKFLLSNAGKISKA